MRGFYMKLSIVVFYALPTSINWFHNFTMLVFLTVAEPSYQFKDA